MNENKLEEIEAKLAHFKELENSLPAEAKKILLSEINNLVISLNKDIEEYLLKMKEIELQQA